MGLPARSIEIIEEVSAPSRSERLAWFAVAVAGLGYFVDVFDMWLFANLRITSLQSLGLSGTALTDFGATIINFQQSGLLLGGFVFGIMGDRRGRVSVMFGSILLYSVATLATAFVTNVEMYAILRFFTGFGLAGEIGAGITLVSELLPKEKRGYGTTFVATLGVAGALAAGYASKVFVWRHAYIFGGIMGLTLLALRIAVYESGMYASMSSHANIRRGSLKLLFGSMDRVGRFVCCILVGIPIYFVFALLVTFSPEISAALGIQEKLIVPDVMMAASLGITFGDLCSGLLSQRFKSRKKPIMWFLGVGFFLSLLLCNGYFSSATGYLVICGIVGFCTGYWACLITTVSEQFGTNLRATVTTAVPNLIRASAILLNLAFISLKGISDPAQAALWLCIAAFGLAFVALSFLRETYGRDLEFFEM